MNSKDYNNIDINLKDVEPEYAPMVKNLVNEKVNTRKEARNKLVEMKAKVLPSIYTLFESKNELLRWEAAKIIQEIASPESIPFLISLLEAEESEIRWIAAEGLIQIGRSSIKPLLKKLINEQNEPFYLINGTHHVLGVLLDKIEKERFKQLLNVLKEKKGLQVSIPVLARKALHEGSF
jgi:HEAT repeat protein